MERYIATYLRLSQDDEAIGESNSITSQRQILAEYVAAMPEFAGVKTVEFADDGWSGTNFDRPGVKRLLKAVYIGEVSCIVVKDFSRFGRQYLAVCKLIEQVFPYFGVRFIAVNDHYDSNSHMGTTAGIDMPVRNLMNAIYSKDISKKVKSAKRTQWQKGVFSNAFAPYGYQKDELDRHRLVIDEQAAIIVRRIFALAVEGGSSFQIADKLNKDGVLSPSAYKKSRGSKLAVCQNTRALWTSEIVSSLLRDERYTGMLIGGRRETLAVGSGKKRKKQQHEWIRIPDAIPAIISRETFCELIAKRKRFGNHVKPNTDRILYQKVRCGYCGHMLRYNGNTPAPYYRCETARYSEKLGCSRQRCPEQRIIDAVGAAAQFHVMLSMAKRIGEKHGIQSAQASQADIERLDAEIMRLRTYKRRLYEQYRRGSLRKDVFLGEREAIETAISAKKARSDMPPSKRGEPSGASGAARRHFASERQHQAMPALPDKGLNALIEAVYVFGADRMEIRFSFRDEMENTMDKRLGHEGFGDL